jgi:hypothetical protein
MTSAANDPSNYCLSDLIDLEIPDADTPQLIRRLVGTDAEARYREGRSLWQLLEEQADEGARRGRRGRPDPREAVPGQGVV